MGFKIHFSCVSHIGNCRSMNQDNIVCDGQYMEIARAHDGCAFSGVVCTREPAVFGVFDGMGGEERGEMAAFLAARKAAGFSFGVDIADDLLRYCRAANEEICWYAKENAVASMGTTAAMLVFDEKDIVLCNIGDSKIFRCADGVMEQISHDHVADVPGKIKPPLSQNLGIPTEELLIEPYVTRLPYVPDETYLICSDGLTDMLSVDEIQKTLGGASFEQIGRELLERALAGGGRDNISVIVCRVKRERSWPWSRLLGAVQKKKEP